MEYGLIDAVLKAGDILMEGLNYDLKAKYKGKADIVTEIDVKSEEFLKGELNRIYKDYSIIAEETENSLSKLKNSQKTIYIDPLDGTTNYFHRFPFFAISVALYNGLLPEVGIVYNPYYKELFYGESGKGAFFNGRKIEVNKRKDMNESLIVTGFSATAINDSNGDSLIKILKNVSLNSHGIRRVGSAALDLCYVAKGIFEGFYEKGLKPWDVAAGKIIVEEAGGKITDEAGGTHNFESTFIIASNNCVHQRLLEIINYKV
jgi:myo-inositol-1(or 4)-monophosphatase